MSSSRTIWRCRFTAIWLNGRAEQGQVVLAVHLHALVEQAGREPLRGPGGQPDRADDHLRDQPRHQREHDDQRDADDDHRIAGHVGRRLFGVEREEVVELEDAGPRTLHR